MEAIIKGNMQFRQYVCFMELLFLCFLKFVKNTICLIFMPVIKGKKLP